MGTKDEKPPILATLLLARHGETEWVRTGRIQGHSDIPLTPHGVRQAERLADRLTGTRIGSIYASDLSRTRQTAEILALPQGRPVRLRRELRECNFGAVEGLVFDQVSSCFPEIARGWLDRSMAISFPAGESLEQVRTRAVSFFSGLCTPTPEGTTLVVGHNGTLKWGIGHLMGWEPTRWWDYRLEPGSLTVLTWTEDGVDLQTLGDVSHLTGLEEAGQG